MPENFLFYLVRTRITTETNFRRAYRRAGLNIDANPSGSIKCDTFRASSIPVYNDIADLWPDPLGFGVLRTLRLQVIQKIRFLISQLQVWLQLRLGYAQGQLLLSLLGLISGLFAGLIIVAFRLGIEHGQLFIFTADGANSFESLGALARFALPLCGGLVLGGLLQHLGPIRVGVLHVMERLAYHEGYLPLRNAVVQFFGAAVGLICGHSVGREGPSIHLGAAGASLLGQWWALPNNSIRTLVACGTAAAIGASFNTPLAGVVFAMEVVMMDYSVATFMPVIMAAVGATVVSRYFLGAEPAFSVPPLALYSLTELPFIVIMGFVIGVLSVSFMQILKWVTETTRKLSLWRRTTLGGAIVGLCAIPAPEIMGIGYDTVNAVLLAEVGLGAVLLIVALKLLATSVSIGMGIPAGLIGPILFLGATAGGTLGLLGTGYPGPTSHPGLYAMLGMGAMMSATLQAPLAALLALLELTANPHIILPGMLAIVTANLTVSDLFHRRSVFLSQMDAMGLDYRNDPVAQSLRRLGVAAAMSRQFVVSTPRISRDQAEEILRQAPVWVIVEREPNAKVLLPAADIHRALADTDGDALDLMEIPSQRLTLTSVHLQATLHEARQKLAESKAEALYVSRPIAPLTDRIYGVITRRSIEEYFGVLR